MLVGSGMEHHLRLIGTHQPLQAGYHPDIANNRSELHIGIGIFELQTDIVHRGLRHIEEQQFLQAEGTELAADLAADGSGSSGYEHGLALKLVFDILHIDLDLVTAQQVFNAHLRQTGRTDLAVADLFGLGQQQQADLGFLTITDQPLLLGFHILTVLEQQGIGLGMAQQFPEIPLILYGIKFQAADTLGIPAAETDITEQQIIAHQRRERGRSHRLFLGIDIDQQTTAGIHTLGLKRVLIKQQQQHTHQNQQGKGEKKIQQSIEHPKRSGQFIDKNKTDQTGRCQSGKQAGEHDAQGFRQRRVTDNAFIGAEQQEEKQRAGHAEHQKDPEGSEGQMVGEQIVR